MDSSYKDVLFFLGFALFGFVLYNARLYVNKAWEEERKDDHWVSELLFGGAGYYRTVFTFMGIIFTIVGMLGAVWHILRLIDDN